MNPEQPTSGPSAPAPKHPSGPGARRSLPSRVWTLCSGAGGPASIACSLGILAVIVVVAILTVLHSLGQVTTLRSRGESVEHAYRVLLSTSNVHALLTDAETGQRGFLLTGDAAYLDPYKAAIAAIEQELTHLESLTAATPEQTPRLARVRSLIGQKLEELEHVISVQRQNGPQAAAMIVRSGEGKAAMDALRDELTAITREEQRRLSDGETRVVRAEQGLRSLLVTRAVLLIALLVAAWFLNLALIRRRAELARSRDLLATTLASIGDGIIVTDARGRVTFLNTEAERLTGWTSREAAGRALPDVFRIVNEQTRTTVENPVDKVLRLGTVVGLANHTILISRDGRETAIDDSAAPIRASDDTLKLFGVVLVFRDFTQHKAMEHQLLEHQRTLEARVTERTRDLESAHHRLRIADRMAAVGTLASGLAHDMKNVLLPLSLRMESALANPGLAPEARADLGAVTALIEHLREMARNLSLFARDPEQEGTEGRTELAAWSDRVRGFIDVSVMENPRHPGRKLMIEWRIPADLPPVRVAPHRLTQAVLNLVHNARDAILAVRHPGTGPACSRPDAGRITVTAEPESAGAAVALRVSDDGCGMDEATLRRATEPFFTTKDRESTPGLAGSGLGLSLASAIAERCGGRLEIESRIGQGSTVSIIVPIAAPEPAESLPARLARINIENKQRRAVIVGILRGLRYDVADGIPPASAEAADTLWITEPAAADPARAAEFLRQKPGRHVVVLGGGGDWRTIGATVLEPGAPVSTLRDVISGLR
ncbi:MAG: CHASE3 domain-containing protein [Phycisphaerales bacterium]|nr:CHASE3 domain-containing protein [Phycisphaerales bacterium]